jgi:hypothetical protein
MRLKSELYKQEQEDIVNKIINILDLENKNTYTLYEIDKNKEIQQQIMDLIPEIRKWYSFNSMKAVGEPQNIKRPYLSIIKYMLKNTYNIVCKDFQFTIDNIHIRTKKYIFQKKRI